LSHSYKTIERKKLKEEEEEKKEASVASVAIHDSLAVKRQSTSKRECHAKQHGDWGLLHLVGGKPFY